MNDSAETIGELSRRLGRSKSTICYSIRRLGLVIPDGPGKVKLIDPESAARIAADYHPIINEKKRGRRFPADRPRFK